MTSRVDCSRLDGPSWWCRSAPRSWGVAVEAVEGTCDQGSNQVEDIKGMDEGLAMDGALLTSTVGSDERDRPRVMPRGTRER